MQFRKLVAIVLGVAMLAGGLFVASRPAQAATYLWMDNAYGSRYGMSIQTYDENVGSGLTLSFTFDHAAMVAATKSQADGDDIRIGFLNYLNHQWTDVPRMVAPNSSWAQKNTRLFFKTQQYIDNNRSNGDYYLYFDNPAAVSPPNNPANIVETFDDFTGATGAPDSAKWTVDTRTGMTVRQEGGQLRITGTAPTGCANCENNYYGINAVNVNYTNVVMEADVIVASGTSSTVRNRHTTWIGMAPEQLAVDTNGGVKSVAWYDSSGTTFRPLAPSTVATADTATHRFESEYLLDRDQLNFREDGFQVAQRPSVDLSFVRPYFGIVPRTLDQAVDIRFDNIVVRQVPVIEPTVSIQSGPMSTWNGAYSAKRQIVVENPSSSAMVPNGYSIPVTFDHASLVPSNSLANGNDVRVVHFNGSTWTELDRILDPKSAWNTSTTKIWFRTQAPLQRSANRSSYYLFYGNASAGAPPANGARIFDVYDDFSSGSINPSRWSLYTQAGRTDTVSSGRYVQSGASSTSQTYDQGLRTRQSFQSGWVAESTFTASLTAPTANTYELWAGPYFDRLYLSRYENSTNSLGYYNEGNSSFVSYGSTTLTGTTLDARLATRITNDGVATWAENGAVRATRTGTPLTGHGQSEAFFGFTPYTTSSYTVTFDDIWIRKAVPVEPTATVRTNVAPNAPTSLLQRVNNVSIAPGTGATGFDNITFAVTGTDPDAGDRGQLCIELQPAGVAFTGVEQSCSGSPDSMGSGNGTLQNNIGDLADGTAWRWQARTRDAAGLYSPWVDYNANGTAADIYLDSVAPSVPTGLSQTLMSNGTAIPTGGWVNTSGVTIGATIADAASPVRLCVERKTVSETFNGTTSTCSAYQSNGPVTVDISSSFGTQYHWQVRAQDIAGNVSAFATFGGNSDTVPADADFGYDGINPTVGQAWDGLSAGVQSNVASASMTTLTANYSGFTDPHSGIAYYMYAVGTTPGGTDVRGWTNNGLATTVTATGLSLRTGQSYYFAIRAHDNVGNNSSQARTAGQTVAPTLTANLDKTSATFDLSSANGFANNQSVSVTTSTNAANGYGVYLSATAPQTSGGTTLTNTFTGTWATPASWTGYGVGYTSSDTSVSGSNRFNGASRYALLPTSGSQLVADNTSVVNGTTGPVLNETFTIGLRTATNPLQPAGRYTTTLQFSFLPNF